MLEDTTAPKRASSGTLLFLKAEVIEGVLGCWVGGIGDAEDFFGVGVSRSDLDCGWFDVKGSGDQCADGFVGLAVFWCGGDAYFESITEHAGDFICGGAGDCFDGEEYFWHR